MSGLPTYAYVPVFTPSAVDCIAPSIAERRSRIEAGGMYFRSYDVGQLNTNSIAVSCMEEKFNATSGFFEPINSNIDSAQIRIIMIDIEEPLAGNYSIESYSNSNEIVVDGDVTIQLQSQAIQIGGTTTDGYYFVYGATYNAIDDETTLNCFPEITISGVGGDIDIVYSEQYTAAQTFVVAVDDCDSWTSGITDVSALVNLGSLKFQMPPRSSVCGTTPSVYDSFSEGTEDASHASSFGFTFLVGGSGAPIDDTTLNTIRTGPTRTIVIISSTEFNDADPLKGDGDIVQPPANRRVLEWDGFDWVQYIPFS